jgi:hypothetical protein
MRADTSATAPLARLSASGTLDNMVGQQAFVGSGPIIVLGSQLFFRKQDRNGLIASSLGYQGSQKDARVALHMLPRM